MQDFAWKSLQNYGLFLSSSAILNVVPVKEVPCFANANVLVTLLMDCTNESWDLLEYIIFIFCES